jgi:hypothetical protein
MNVRGKKAMSVSTSLPKSPVKYAGTTRSSVWTPPLAVLGMERTSDRAMRIREPDRHGDPDKVGPLGTRRSFP